MLAFINYIVKHTEQLREACGFGPAAANPVRQDGATREGNVRVMDHHGSLMMGDDVIVVCRGCPIV